MDPRLVRGAAFAMLCGIWGSTWLVIRVGLEGAPAFLAASLRFVLASITLLIVAVILRSPIPRTRREWALIGFVGIVLFTADYGLIYWAESEGVQSGVAAVLFATMPLQTALFAHAFIANERITAQKIIGITAGFLGIVVIFQGQLGSAGAALFLPMLAIVLSAACAAISTVAVKRWGHDANPVSFNGFAMAVGAAALAALSLSAAEPWVVPSWPEGILAIVYLALAGSVVTFVAYLWLLRQTEATTMSYIALITPIVAVFLGVSVGAEVFDPLVLVGTAVTLAGVYVSVSGRVAALGQRFARGKSAEIPAVDPAESRR